MWRTSGDRGTLALAAAAELRLRQPAAHAIVRHARRNGCIIPERSESEYLLGLGVRAEVDGRRLPETMEIAHDAMRLVCENPMVVAVPNDLGLALAAAGIIGPAGATVANNGSTVVAALTSLRPLLGGAAADLLVDESPAADEPNVDEDLEIRSPVHSASMR